MELWNISVNVKLYCYLIKKTKQQAIWHLSNPSPNLRILTSSRPTSYGWSIYNTEHSVYIQNDTQRPAYLTLQEEEDSSFDKAAIEALPAPPG